MEICEYVEKATYGEDSFRKFDKERGMITDEPALAIWIDMYMGEHLGVLKWAIPVSAMIPFENGDIYRKTYRMNMKTKKKELFVWYRMVKKSHADYTYNKNKSDGTPMLKSKAWREKYGQGGAVTSGRRRGDKQYWCQSCRRDVDIERDNSNNAYCCNCGKKMFQKS